MEEEGPTAGVRAEAASCPVLLIILGHAHTDTGLPGIRNWEIRKKNNCTTCYLYIASLAKALSRASKLPPLPSRLSVGELTFVHIKVTCAHPSVAVSPLRFVGKCVKLNGQGTPAWGHTQIMTDN